MGTQCLTKEEGSSLMDQDRFIPHQKIQMSKALWDFGSYPERKGDGLLFEKEVLDIQV